ncbi:MAG: alanine/ornithine racemase family PLP-dependent enzyme [Chloroflexota bacterium]
MFPQIELNAGKIEANTRSIVDLAARHGVAIAGVTKVLCGAPEAGRAMLAGGVKMLAESRLENIERLRAAGLPGPYLMLRLPMVSQVDRVVALAEYSLVSELKTIRALDRAAGRAGVQHRVILMVDLGDLREGFWPDELIPAAVETAKLGNIVLAGIGVNLTCYGGICPTPANLGQLVQLARDVEQATGVRLEIVSGGNSSSLAMLMAGALPQGINHLRIGEGAILGRETIAREPIPGAHLDACIIRAEVIEVREKPSVPIGQIGQDAFGNTPVYEDVGNHLRAICAIGRQDCVPDGLTPVDPAIRILGASSDHLLLDVTKAATVPQVGDVIEFIPGYGALLLGMTSPYVDKLWI